MRSWLLLAGAALTVYGGFRLVSGVWGEGAMAEAGPNNTLISAIVIGVGIVCFIAAYFVKPSSGEEGD